MGHVRQSIAIWQRRLPWALPGCAAAALYRRACRRGPACRRDSHDHPMTRDGLCSRPGHRHTPPRLGGPNTCPMLPAPRAPRRDRSDRAGMREGGLHARAQPARACVSCVCVCVCVCFVYSCAPLAVMCGGERGVYVARGVRARRNIMPRCMRTVRRRSRRPVGADRMPCDGGS